MRQDQAFETLKLGYNVFLTGAAGSGKTYLLNRYIRHLRDHNVRVAVTASTGIAATHLGGQTIHSWSGIGVQKTLDKETLDTICGNKRVRRNVRRCKVLVIDEISMLHAFQLEMVDQVTRRVLDLSRPFGGLQLVLCGDFFQLPPVADAGTAAPFAFESEVWSRSQLHICYLSEQHRQGNDPLLSVLNDIRNSTAGEQTKVPLRTRYRREPLNTRGEPVQPTVLFARNVNVNALNERELAALPGDLRSFRMTSRGFHKLVEVLRNNCLAPEELRVKIGAQVIFIKNATDGAYVNGTRGYVDGFDVHTGWPLVKTLRGARIVASPEDWNYEEHGIVRASITQVPLRLAWAITVHKSQGMTLDAAEIDLSDAFEPGMGYVALSRVRSLNGLKLMGLNEIALRVHSTVAAQDKIFQRLSAVAENELSEIAPDEQERRQNTVLRQRFGAEHLEVPRRAKRKREKREKIKTHEVTGKLAGQGLGLEAIAAERGLSVSTLITHLEKLKGLGSLPPLDHIRAAIPAQDFDAIFEKFKNSDDGKLTPIFAAFEGRYDFNLLKVVRLFA